jgi:hypothetical protein
VALRGIGEREPMLQGRQWTDAEYAERDAVLAGLGIAFRSRRQRAIESDTSVPSDTSAGFHIPPA